MVRNPIWAAVGAGLLLSAACSGDDGGAGAAGKPCSVKDNGDGTATITCPGAGPVIVKGGQGKDGDSGAPGPTGDSGDPGPAGDAGTSCTIADNGNGTKTITCTDGTTITVSDAMKDYAKLTAAEKAVLDPTLTITKVDFPTSGKPVIDMKITDKNGNPVKGMDSLTTGAGLTWRASVLKLVAGGATAPGKSGSDTWVGYIAANATTSAGTESANATTTAIAGQGTLKDNGDGTYTYTFDKNITDEPNAGTKYEADKTHRVVVLAYKSGTPTNPFRPMDAWKDLVPQTGADMGGKNDKVNGDSCMNCHSDWKAPANATAAFHSGTRYEIHVCVACHNDQRRFASTATGTAPVEPTMSAGTKAGTVKWTGSASVINGEAVLNLPVFIHKIHMGEELALHPDRANGSGQYTAAQFDEVTYPQDVRNCGKCHNTVDKADNWKNVISRRACGACHDGRSFEATPPFGRVAHSGGPYADDTECANCHGAGKSNAVDVKHVAVAEPATITTGTLPASPDGQYVASGWQWDGTKNVTCTVALPCTCTVAKPCLASANSNASWVAAAGYVPTGAAKLTYDVKEVLVTTAKNPSIVFKILKDGTAVDFGTYDATTKPELITGFVGSTSAYFAWSISQDGITAPADFNQSASAYIRTAWSAPGTTLSLTKDATTGYYTLTILNVVLPSTAKMVTGGLGYTYSMTSTQPFTQVDLTTKYPYDPATKIGGLSVPAPNVWKVATGYTARRPIVETARCNKCHDGLGVSPTFHSGQRNDGPTCSFCHNPNRVNGGWAVNSKDIIHSIHGGGKRTVPFTWHGEIKAWEVTYPGVLNTCTQCHVDNGYNFSTSAATTALPNLLMSYAANGKYSLTPTAPATIAPFLSPYVTPGTEYGSLFATSNGTSGVRKGVACKTATPCTVATQATDCASGVCNDYGATSGGLLCIAPECKCSVAAPCQADDTTLVKSPITAACSACHDSPTAVKHFTDNGGSFFKTRAQAMASTESCLMCHGPSKIAAIAEVHK